MTTDQPIACSLTPAQLSERREDFAKLAADALLQTRSADGAKAELVFAAGKSVRDRLQAIVAAEAECCPFLSMQLRDGADTITLEILAPDGAAAKTLSDLVGSDFKPA
jgi:hypothetical protein